MIKLSQFKFEKIQNDEIIFSSLLKSRLFYYTINLQLLFKIITISKLIVDDT